MRVNRETPAPPQPVRERQTPRAPEPQERTMKVPEKTPEPPKQQGPLGKNLDVKA